jgi:hypothetical protein
MMTNHLNQKTNHPPSLPHQHIPSSCFPRHFMGFNWIEWLKTPIHQNFGTADIRQQITLTHEERKNDWKGFGGGMAKRRGGKVL